jgi:hypothetical protein
MSRRVVSVELSLEVAAYLANARRVDTASKDMREEIDRLSKAGAGLGKVGLAGMLAGLPGIASAGAAGVGLLSATVLSGAAAFGTMKLATVGVGDAMTAVADGDAAKLDEAMSDLTAEAQTFVREYQRVRGVLDQVGDATQSALFAQLAGDLEQLTGTYIPVLLRQAPALAREVGAIGTDFADWATAPATVGKVNRQFDLAITLAGHLSRMLRAGTAVLLDMGDAGASFADRTVGGLADGTEALQRWVAAGRATGQVNQIFENGSRIVEELGSVLADLGPVLADVVDNPALVDGASALFDVFHIGITVVSALLNAFEALPSGVQSGVVTLAVFGGATLIVTGRVLALKASLDAMKVSAVQAGTAVKGVGSMLGGPWGIAIGAAIGAIGIFASEQSAAKARIQEVANSLDIQTGAFTQNTRAVIANHLQTEGTLKLWEQMGVSGDRVVDAVLGNASAMRELRDAAARQDPSQRWFLEDVSIPELQKYSGEIDQARINQEEIARAIGNTTDATKEQTSAVNELAAALKRQTDPLFNLIEAQREVTEAQSAYNTAVKEHGKNSQEARDASLALAKAAVELTGATGEAAGMLGGKLSPELRATLEAAHLTEQQIADVEKSIRDATSAAGEFEGDYNANLTANAAQAQAELDAVIAKVLSLKDKSIRIDARVFWTSNGDLKVPGGTLFRRWGGITEHAQSGLLRDAAVYSPVAAGARYAFAEPATGGEAFVPKYGDYGRSMQILSEAARWYGASVQPGGATGGSSGGGGNTYNTTYEIRPLRSNLDANEMRAITAEVDAYDRAGRTR